MEAAGGSKIEGEAKFHGGLFGLMRRRTSHVLIFFLKQQLMEPHISIEMWGSISCQSFGPRPSCKANFEVPISSSLPRLRCRAVEDLGKRVQTLGVCWIFRGCGFCLD